MKRRVAIGRLFFSFRGRISRAMWWLAKAVWLGSACLIGPLQQDSSETIYTVLALLWSPLFLWSWIVLDIKRFHDRNLSGWLLLVGVVPIIGSIYCFVHLGFLPSDSGKNRYGPPPEPLKAW